MFHKIDGTKNGYTIDASSTNEDWKEICEGYKKVRCIICNNQTSKYFRIPLLGSNTITINNKLLDGVVYINGAF